jgi:prepilin-type N-terminal cleavage/methylation domain-containing protein
MMISLKSRQSGFTLIELMVAVAIIGVLMAAGLVSFSIVQKSARDSRRKADVRALATAAEEYYFSGNASYPTATANINTYFSGALPLDPKTKASYTYSLTASQFCICATLENAKGNATGAAAGVCTWSSAATATRFCVGSSQ